jgi:hypothetical protein
MSGAQMEDNGRDISTLMNATEIQVEEWGKMMGKSNRPRRGTGGRFMWYLGHGEKAAADFCGQPQMRPVYQETYRFLVLAASA